jgi:hypothetical protein
MNTDDVVGDYTDCKELKSSRAPRGGTLRNTIHVTDRNAVNNSLNLKRACSANRRNPMCAVVTQKSTGEQVKQVLTMVAEARMRTARSVEDATEKRGASNRRYQQAACSRVVESASGTGP